MEAELLYTLDDFARSRYAYCERLAPTGPYMRALLYGLGLLKSAQQNGAYRDGYALTDGKIDGLKHWIESLLDTAPGLAGKEIARRYLSQLKDYTKEKMAYVWKACYF